MTEHPPRGRGSAENPPNRFHRLHVEPDLEDVPPEERSDPRTEYLRATARTILTTNDSPDVGFTLSVNPYSGCEHGCAYCYARPYHEYWGFSAGLDFETRILVKESAPELLRKALLAEKYQPQVVAMSGVTDCYQPVERELKLTRRCLEVLAEFRNPVCIITKNRLVARDADVLGRMARWRGAGVFLSVTTLDDELAGELEPRASRPRARLEAIRALAGAGVQVGVHAAPMIPGLTDHELPAILKAAAEAGARFAGYGLVRLPGAVEGLFDQWLERHYPNSRARVMRRIREAHGGQANDTRFGVRMRGEGVHADQLHALFVAGCRKAGLRAGGPELSTDSFRRPRTGQLSLF